MEALKDEIIVTIGQVSNDGKIEDLLDKNNKFMYIEPNRQLEYLNKIIQVARQDEADFVVFPEFFLPRQYLATYLKPLCEEIGAVLIGGLEYGEKVEKSNIICNEAFIAIPYNLHTRTLSNPNCLGCKPDGKKSTVIQIPKLQPAPLEKETIEKTCRFSNGDRLYIFKNRYLGNWAVLICFDFLNIAAQALLQSNIHTLFVVAYNKDTDGFAAVADTVQRLLMCNVVVCNTGFFGGSLAFSPFRERYKRYSFNIKGNNIGAAVSVKLPLKVLAQHQKDQLVRLSDEEKPLFIHKPPAFGMIGNLIGRR